jgi:hypothetical protein
MSTAIIPALAQAAYGITLRDEEVFWLTTPADLLTPLERQHRFLLQKALEPLQCPACLRAVCLRSTEPGWNPRKAGDDTTHICPLCQAKLHWHLGITGDSWYTLLPGQTIVTGHEPATAQ